jgi:hypothetical protein
MITALLIGALLASGTYLFLLYRQVNRAEEQLRLLVEKTEQNLVDTWNEVRYLRPDNEELLAKARQEAEANSDDEEEEE